MHQYLEIGDGILIPMYNLLIGIGAVFGFLYLEKEIKKFKVDFKTDRNIYLSLIVSIGLGFVGAKLFELLYHGYKLSFQTFFTGGITVMGGITVGAISFLIINSILKTNNQLAFNLLIPFVIIIHFFGRIGCFLAGCCYGKPTNSFFGVMYPDNSLPSLHLGCDVHLHPTQFYEALFLLLLFVVVVKVKRFALRTPIYLVGYGFFRFFIEFLRGDDRGQLFTDILTPSQFLSLLFILIGLLIYITTKKTVK